MDRECSSKCRLKETIIRFPTCTIHEGLELLFLHSLATEKLAFKCSLCIIEEQLPIHQLVSLQQISISNSDTYFMNWPLSSNSSSSSSSFAENRSAQQVGSSEQEEMERLILNVKSILSSPPRHKELKLQIESFFKEFKANTLAKIDKIKEEMELKAEKLWDFRVGIISEYNKVSAKDSLREIVKQMCETKTSATSLRELDSKVKRILSAAADSRESNKRSLLFQLEQLRELERVINLEQPELVKAKVYSLIDSLSFFTLDEIGNEDELNVQDSIQVEGVALQEQLHQRTNAKLLELLVLNPLNFLEGNLAEQVKRILANFRRLLNRLDRLDGSHLKEFDSLETQLLTNEQLLEIKGIIKQMVQGNKQKAQGMVDLKYFNVQDIMEHLKLSASFPAERELEKIEAMLKKVSHFIESNCSSTENQVKLTSNEQFRVRALAELMLRIRMTNSSSRMHSSLRTSLIKSSEQEVFKSSTHRVLDVLKRNRILIGRDGKADGSSSIEQFLLEEFPVFELVSLTEKFEKKFLPIEFEKTGYFNSAALKLVRCAGSNGQGGLRIEQTNSIDGSVMSMHTLEKEKTYVIRCKFNRPYDCVSIRIGLVSRAKAASQNISDSAYGEFSTNSENGMNLVLKGQKLNSDEVRAKVVSLEFRINIRNQEFYVADYPDYEHVNQVEKKYIDSEGEYQFAIGFASPGNSWSVTVTDFLQLSGFSNIGQFLSFEQEE